MKIYDLIFQLLTDRPEDRDSDKKLVWDVYNALGLIKSNKLDFYDFMLERCPSTETIRRCRQKIQETHPELAGSIPVTRMRRQKALTRGNFIYQEQSPRYEFVDNIAVPVHASLAVTKQSVD